MNDLCVMPFSKSWIRRLGLFCLVLATSGSVFASTVFDTYNADKGPGYALPRPPCCTWNVDSIGWYWTSPQTMYLESIQTKLADVDIGYDNQFYMTVRVYTERPAAGGLELASFRFDANGFLPGYEPWRGGFFETPLQVSGGTQYYVNMSGWISDRYPGNTGRGGINWIIDGFNGPLPAGAEFPGNGTSWTDNGNTLMGTNTVTSAPVLQFVGSPVPVPAAVWLFGSALVWLGVFGHPRKG